LDPAGLNRAQDSDDIEPQSHLGFDQSGNLLKVPDGTKAFEENRIFSIENVIKMDEDECWLAVFNKTSMARQVSITLIITRLFGKP
jgi:hypothetical protein